MLSFPNKKRLTFIPAQFPQQGFLARLLLCGCKTSNKEHSSRDRIHEQKVPGEAWEASVFRTGSPCGTWNSEWISVGQDLGSLTRKSVFESWKSAARVRIDNPRGMDTVAQNQIHFRRTRAIETAAGDGCQSSDNFRIGVAFDRWAASEQWENCKRNSINTPQSIGHGDKS